jgi:adenosine kinase
MSLSSNTFEKNHGGTGANIAYNLALLGENPILLSSVGHDYSFDGIMEDKVNLNYIHRDKMEHSANSIIVSDRDDNRMTFFHP